MPRISEMPKPAVPLSGLELIPAIQGGGTDAAVGLPILTSGSPYGGAVVGLRLPMLADLSSTAAADPGAGKLRWNAAPPSASEIYIADADTDGGDMAAVLTALNVSGYLYLQGAADSAARDNWQKWQVTAITAGSGYTTLAVALQSSAGAIADGAALELTAQQPVPSTGVDRNVVTAVSSSSGALTLDASAGDYFTVTLTEAVTALSITNVPPAVTLGLWITAAGSYGVTWPTAWNWGDGETAPDVSAMTAGAVLFVVITTCNAGTTWDASSRVRA